MLKSLFYGLILVLTPFEISHQARDSQRQLRTEWENIMNDLESQRARLNNMEEEIKKFK